MFKLSIGEDKMACIKDGQRSTVSELSKHIDVKFQFLVDHFTNGEDGLHFVASRKMVSDTFS